MTNTTVKFAHLDASLFLYTLTYKRTTVGIIFEATVDLLESHSFVRIVIHGYAKYIFLEEC